MGSMRCTLLFLNSSAWDHPTKFLFFCPSAWARLHSAYEPYWVNRKNET
jgi:hypothetical protein